MCQKTEVLRQKPSGIAVLWEHLEAGTAALVPLAKSEQKTECYHPKLHYLAATLASQIFTRLSPGV